MNHSDLHETVTESVHVHIIVVIFTFFHKF